MVGQKILVLARHTATVCMKCRQEKTIRVSTLTRDFGGPTRSCNNHASFESSQPVDSKTQRNTASEAANARGHKLVGLLDQATVGAFSGAMQARKAVVAPGGPTQQALFERH